MDPGLVRRTVRPGPAVATTRPGPLIRAALGRAGMTQTELAQLSGMTLKHLNRLIHGRVPLSAMIAVRIEAVLEGVAAEDLMALQVRADIAKARKQLGLSGR
jgi:addiction module HigA family antidote